MEFLGNVPHLVRDWEWFSPESQRYSDACAILSHFKTERQTILDCPCGTGIMSTVLSKAGHEVMGVDINTKFIDKARKTSSTLGTNVSFLVHDMSKFIKPNSFSLILNWNNSFGYFSHETNLRMLCNFQKSIVKNGHLLIECENMDVVKDSYPDCFGDGNIYWDGSSETMHYLYGDTECVRIHYSIKRLKEMLIESDFTSVVVYGPHFTSITPKSERFIIEAGTE